MSFLNKISSLAGWLSFAIIAILSHAYSESANKPMDFWNNKKGGIASWILYAIVVVILIIILVLALRFLFGII